MLAILMLTAALAAAPKWTPVRLDDLEPYKQVLLTLASDTLDNCDTAGQYKRVIRRGTEKAEGRDGKIEFDQLKNETFPITWLTFLKARQDSLYFIATVSKSEKETFYTSLCLERKNIRAAYGEAAPEVSRERGKKEHHGRGRGMRGGDGGGW